MRILRKSRNALAIECRFNKIHFELFHGIFLLFHIHMELFSVISRWRFIYLTLLRPLILIWLRNYYTVPATKPQAPISTAFTTLTLPFPFWWVSIIYQVISFLLTVDFKTNLSRSGGARGVVVIVVGNGHGDSSSNPGRDWLHFT